MSNYNVDGEYNVNMVYNDGVIVATTTTRSIVPTYSAGATITAVVVITTTQSIVPVGSGGAAITAVVAMVTTQSIVPVVSGGIGVTAVVAVATIQSIAPVGSGGATITAIVVATTTQSIVPAYSAGAGVTAVVATTTSQSIALTYSAGAAIIVVVATTTTQSIVPVVAGGAGITAVVVTTTTAMKTPHAVYGLKKLKTGLADAMMRWFKMNDKLYGMNGTNYIQYDGTNVVDVTSIAYIPEIILNRTPTGGGNANEEINLLTPSVIDSFNGNGSATTYQLSKTVLDAAAVTVSIDSGVTYNKVEDTHFTANRTNGTIDFTGGSTPLGVPASGTNNVKIKYAKTNTGYANRILNCKVAVIFGGENDTKVIFAGNANYKGYLWYTPAYDPTYIPENNYNRCGNSSEDIMNMKVQFDTCIIEKEFSKWYMRYEIDSVGIPYFTIRPTNDVVGICARDTSQLINNNPAGLTTKGVYILSGGTVRDERNVVHISERIDKDLLVESNLEDAISVDISVLPFNKQYWICVNDNVYAYDYVKDEWYIYDNIPANCFMEYNDYLYFGDNSTGMVYKFNKLIDVMPFTDNGEAINAYWKSMLLNFGNDELYKQFMKLFFLLKPDARSSADLYYITGDGESASLKTGRSDLFDYSYYDYSYFSYICSVFPQEFIAKVKEKKRTHFQIMMRNNRDVEGMGILSVGIKHSIQSEVR